MEGKLPNLLVIGAMKCGTTSLHDYLNQHPDIFMSEKKELDFFIKERAWGNGLDWYKAQFPVEKNIRGESSQDYSKYHWWHGVPQRIYQTLGDNVKFIYLMRNPLARIYSHYNEMQAQNCAPKDLEAYIVKDLAQNEIVMTSCYGKQLTKYLEYFEVDNFHFTSLEKLQMDKNAVLNEICNFLNVDNFPSDVDLNYRKNSSEQKTTSNFLGRIIGEHAGVTALKKMLPNKLKSTLRNSSIVQTISSKPIQSIKLSKPLEEKLNTIFRKDLTYFESLSGIQLTDLLIDIE